MSRAPVTPLPADHSQPLPERVYWAPLADNFYSADGGGMGHDFYAKWYSRRAEFPKGEAWGFGPGWQHNPFKDAPRTAGVQSTVLPHDFITHRDAWRKALVLCMGQARHDDVLYWKHELKAFDVAYAELTDGVPASRQQVKSGKAADGAG